MCRGWPPIDGWFRILAMFKKSFSLPKLAEQRLVKVAVKRARNAKVHRARFLAEIKSAQPNEVSAQEADRLVERVRAAKAAPFLELYRASR